MSENKTPQFVAINYIECKESYVARFEELFLSRAKAIDTIEGFQNMYVLKPQSDGGSYLIVSHWNSEDNFKNWTKSKEFIEGHKRGFEDLRKAKELGHEAPMKSEFKTYKVLTD